MSSVIFHIDMNSYFASCEQQANPHLRGRPVGVCEHLGGIIIAPSIEAKRLGIKTACPVWEAQKICPEIILLPVDPDKYRDITRRFLKIFSDYSDLVERYSIDEAFLDTTDWLAALSLSSRPKSRFERDKAEGSFNPFNFNEQEIPRFASLARNDRKESLWRDALMLALEIKWRIRREVGEWLTCSVGCGPNKLVAKIASDMDKPDGVTVIAEKDVGGLYDKLSLTDIPGIAAMTQRQLNGLGIFSLRDLAEYPESRLRAHFGITGHHLHQMGKLEGGTALVTPAEETVKSMGHAYTMPRATSDERIIKRLLFKLSEKVAARLRRRNLWGSVISCYARLATPPALQAPSRHAASRQVGMKYPSTSPKSERESERSAPLRGGSYSGVGRSRHLKELTNDGRIIFLQAWNLYQKLSVRSPVRMAGVTVSGLVENVRDEPLFPRYRRPQLASQAMDEINGRYGDFTLCRAALLDAQDLAPDTVGFGRIKELR